jgi:hypothetical protein
LGRYRYSEKEMENRKSRTGQNGGNVTS